MANIKRDSDALNSLKGVQGEEFDNERRRLESSIRQNTNKFRKLYELPTPFDPDSLQNQFSSFVKTGLSTAGLDVGKSGSREFERIFGAGGDYSELFQNYEDEFADHKLIQNDKGTYGFTPEEMLKKIKEMTGIDLDEIN